MDSSYLYISCIACSHDVKICTIVKAVGYLGLALYGLAVPLVICWISWHTTTLSLKRLRSWPHYKRACMHTIAWQWLQLVWSVSTLCLMPKWTTLWPPWEPLACCIAHEALYNLHNHSSASSQRHLWFVVTAVFGWQPLLQASMETCGRLQQEDGVSWQPCSP